MAILGYVVPETSTQTIETFHGLRRTTEGLLYYTKLNKDSATTIDLSNGQPGDTQLPTSGAYIDADEVFSSVQYFTGTGSTSTYTLSPSVLDGTRIRVFVNNIEQIYNTLCFKRYFKISEKIGSFKLTRWSLSVGGNYDDFLRKNWFHWEYYAANGCPLWRARLEKCHGVLDHVNENIVFPKDNVNVNVNVNVNNNEPDKEQFYDLYAYEFDELPKDIQRMSHCDIKRAKWQDWYFDVFPSEESKTIIVGLNNEFEFMWY